MQCSSASSDASRRGVTSRICCTSVPQAMSDHSEIEEGCELPRPTIQTPHAPKTWKHVQSPKETSPCLSRLLESLNSERATSLRGFWVEERRGPASCSLRQATLGTWNERRKRLPGALSLASESEIPSLRPGFAGLRPYDLSPGGFLPPHDRLGFQVGCLELQRPSLTPLGPPPAPPAHSLLVELLKR